MDHGVCANCHIHITRSGFWKDWVHVNTGKKECGPKVAVPK
jgi:hypothetical protein